MLEGFQSVALVDELLPGQSKARHGEQSGDCALQHRRDVFCDP